jgi:tripartite-type tricarboxylate transporter receptor subunit TctC
MDRRTFNIGLGGVLFAATAPRAFAQEAFPAKTVRIIVPFPAGSALDGVSRIVAEGLNRAWGGKGVVVENVAGGGGNIGAQRVMRSDPDGYTLLSSAPGPLVLNKLLYKDTNFEAERFVPLTLISTVPNVLVVRNNLPAKTLGAFVEYARANPGKLNYASQGVGSTGFLTGRALEVATKTQMVHVPYRGAAQILTDIAAGHIDSFFDTVTTSLPLHQADKARIIAVAGAERLAALPDVPAISEFVPGFRSITWFAMVAPEGMPAALAERISRDIVAVVRSPEVSSRITTLNMTIRATGPAETAAFLTAERAYWSKLVADIGFESQ